MSSTPRATWYTRWRRSREAQPTNCCLGDGELYVTHSMTGQLVAYEMDARPLPLFEGEGR